MLALGGGPGPLVVSPPLIHLLQACQAAAAAADHPGGLLHDNGGPGSLSQKGAGFGQHGAEEACIAQQVTGVMACCTSSLLSHYFKCDRDAGHAAMQLVGDLLAALNWLDNHFILTKEQVCGVEWGRWWWCFFLGVGFRDFCLSKCSMTCCWSAYNLEGHMMQRTQARPSRLLHAALLQVAALPLVAAELKGKKVAQLDSSFLPDAIKNAINIRPC